MKQIFFAFCFLFSIALQGQTSKEDTSYIVNVGGIFYLITNVEYEDGGYNERGIRLGDTVQFYQNTLNGFLQRADDYSKIVANTFELTRNISAAIRENIAIINATGKNPLDSLAQRARPHLVDAGATWTLVTPTGNASIIFSATANGALRYSVDGATARSVTAFARYIIRLSAYPAQGQFLDLYWDEIKRRYISQDGKFVLRRNVTR